MSSAQIKISMEAKSNELRGALAELSKWHTEKSKEISDHYVREMFDLNVQLRRAQAEEAYQAACLAEDEASQAARAAEEEDEGWSGALARRQERTWPQQAYADGGDELCYNCSGYVDSCGCAEPAEEAFQSQLSPEANLFVASSHAEEHREGTKLKWVSSTNPETYSVAIFKKDGILEVKRVTDGGGHCHDTTVCKCIPCSEIRLSDRLGVPRPPWRRSAPLLKTFFKTEAEWLASLPTGGSRGSLQVTVPAISARKLKKLSCTPLSATTDGLKLKELEERFPGGTIVLQTSTELLEIEHVYYDIAAYPDNWCHQIYSRKHQRSVMDFSDLGASLRQGGKPRLMVDWKGLYIDLSHLF